MVGAWAVAAQRHRDSGSDHGVDVGNPVAECHVADRVVGELGARLAEHRDFFAVEPHAVHHAQALGDDAELLEHATGGRSVVLAREVDVVRFFRDVDLERSVELGR